VIRLRSDDWDNDAAERRTGGTELAQTPQTQVNVQVSAHLRAVPDVQSAARDMLLRIEGVGKSYGAAGSAIVALRGVDLDVRRGEFMTIIGPSGCGKSTLLQIAAGLITPSVGRVILDGKPISAPPPEMVYLFQQYTKSLFPWRNVRDNVAFPLENKALARAERDERATAHLEMVGLAEFANHYPWQLSGGMQQRVAIARALAAAPRVLLMDEPFSAVDALTRLDLQALVLDIWQKRGDLTILFVTHDVEEAVYLSDRIAVLTRRPSSISRIVEPGLGRPRHPVDTREDPLFLRHRHDLLNTLLDRPNERS
jgi:NitT/TauT family transport system ATP-binding protein